MTELKGQARVGAERRAAIVDAAIEVFAKRGFRGSALAEVADRVGLSAAGILYHFGSKEALLLAVIEERDRRAAPQVADLSVEGGLESVRGLVRFAEQSERERGLVALHTVLQSESLDTEALTHDYFLSRSRRLRKGLERTLQHAQKVGEVRDDVDCKATATEIIAFLDGAAVQWLLDEKVSLVALYQGYLDSLIRAIST